MLIIAGQLLSFDFNGICCRANFPGLFWLNNTGCSSNIFVQMLKFVGLQRNFVKSGSILDFSSSARFGKLTVPREKLLLRIIKSCGIEVFLLQFAVPMYLHLNEDTQ